MQRMPRQARLAAWAFADELGAPYRTLAQNTSLDLIVVQDT